MSEAPDPLVPAEVDLRDFGFMPLDVLRLRDSDLAALANGEEFKAEVLLWCAAWHQVPAASLPNDDRLLARFSGAGPLWRKVKAEALRGFVECSDGRLYHSTIAEKALEAWRSKQAQRARTLGDQNSCRSLAVRNAGAPEMGWGGAAIIHGRGERSGGHPGSSAPSHHKAVRKKKSPERGRQSLVYGTSAAA